MNTQQFSQDLIENGWCLIQAPNYQITDTHLHALQEGYLSDLILDPYSHGNRYRAYAQCQFSDPDTLKFGHFHAYQQTQSYNPDTGGIVREYPLIQHNVLSNPLFLDFINKDISFVKHYGLIGDPSELSIGVHLFRYKATWGSPAYSSPIWLHRDDEDVVFVHLINRSEELMGGDNVIAENSKCIETMFRLENPGDTFVVNHKKLHAVTPIGHPHQEGFSFRDIILVTFQLMETAVVHAK